MHLFVHQKSPYQTFTFNCYIISLITEDQLAYFDVYVSEESGDYSDSNLCLSSAAVGPLASNNKGIHTVVRCARTTPLFGRYITLVKQPGPQGNYLTLCDIKIIKFTGL